MLNKSELASAPVDFNLYQKEKDYLQHLILSRIYSRVGNELTFKGGTALQKCYGLNRFSEDLDFTLSGSLRFEKMEDSLKEVARFYPSSFAKKVGKNSFSYVVKVEGPLFQGPITLQTVRIEISAREEPVLPAINRIVNPVYMDLQPYSVLVMDPREILSEKIRALMTRLKARDLYDFHFLLQKQIVLEPSLADEKLKFYNKKYDPEALLSRAVDLKTQWEKVLPSLLKNVPDFAVVISDLKKYLE